MFNVHFHTYSRMFNVHFHTYISRAHMLFECVGFAVSSCVPTLPVHTLATSFLITEAEIFELLQLL
jgi:hypothetical protein